MCTMCVFVFLNKRTDQTSLKSRSQIETLNPPVSFYPSIERLNSATRPPWFLIYSLPAA